MSGHYLKKHVFSKKCEKIRRKFFTFSRNLTDQRNSRSYQIMASNLTLRKKSTLWFLMKNVQKTQKSPKMRKVRSLFSHFRNHKNAPDIFSYFSVLNVTFTHFFEAVELQYAIFTFFRPIKLAKTCQLQSTGILTFLEVGNFVNEKCAKAVVKFTDGFKNTF